MVKSVEFVVNPWPCDLCNHGGLALVRRLFKRIPAGHDRPQYPVRGGIANRDLFK